MRREVIVCDVCGAEGCQSVNVVVDRQPDPAGSSDDIVERIDLCPKHIAWAFGLYMVHARHYAAAKNLVEHIKNASARRGQRL